MRDSFDPRIQACLLLLAVTGCAPDVGTSHAAIVNGVPDHDFPAAVWLELTGGASCSGAIVKVNGDVGYVVTAAHCMEYPPLAILQGETVASPDVVYPVTGYVAHPLYGTAGYTYDFAVVRFSGATASTPFVPVATAGDGLTAGSPIRFAGYGYTAPGGPVSALRMRLDLTVDAAWRETFDVYDTAHGGCPGDSGGPAFATVAGETRLAGVFSNSDVECVGQTLFQRISYVYHDWLAAALDEPMPAQRCEVSSSDASCASCIEGGCCDEAIACLEDVDCLQCLWGEGTICDINAPWMAYQSCLASCAANPCASVAPPQHDAGAGGVDAGVDPGEDAGAPTGDAGDGGVSGVDAGPPDGVDEGCGCRAAGSAPRGRAWLLAVIVAWVVVGRRRR
ncbi:MAG: trypsin-like serine protease [Sandaracinaceae bacterium]